MSKKLVKYVEARLAKDFATAQGIDAASIRKISETVEIVESDEGDVTLRGGYDEIRRIHDALRSAANQKEERQKSESRPSLDRNSYVLHSLEKTRARHSSNSCSGRLASIGLEWMKLEKADQFQNGGLTAVDRQQGQSEGAKKREGPLLSPEPENKKLKWNEGPLAKEPQASLVQDYSLKDSFGKGFKVISTFRDNSTDSFEPIGMYPGSMKEDERECQLARPSLTSGKSNSVSADMKKMKIADGHPKSEDRTNMLPHHCHHCDCSCHYCQICCHNHDEVSEDQVMQPSSGSGVDGKPENIESRSRKDSQESFIVVPDDSDYDMLDTEVMEASACIKSKADESHPKMSKSVQRQIEEGLTKESWV